MSDEELTAKSCLGPCYVTPDDVDGSCGMTAADLLDEHTQTPADNQHDVPKDKAD